MEIRIKLRHTQYQAISNMPGTGIVTGSNIIYAGANPASLKPVLGTVPQPTYIDFTDSISNLDELKLTWTKQRDDTGYSAPGANNPQKSASGQINIVGDAYFFIKDWLIDSISAPMNSVDVMIEDVGCGSYEDFVINSNQITWSEDAICELSVTIQQKDPALQCIQQTVISDNWQGWFQNVPDGGKKHPRFLYCREARPNGLLVVMWWLMGFASVLMILLFPIVNAIILLIGIVKSIIDAISWLFGGHPNFGDDFQWWNPLDGIASWYMESAGCDRMHPAPLIRDYIDNVCKKCGVLVDQTSSPIFHGQKITIDASSGMKENVDNPYYYATYLNAPSEKGFSAFKTFFGKDQNTDRYYIEGNRPILALDQFLDQLKGLFNAEWMVKTVAGQPTLFFWRKDWFVNGVPLYDFSEGSDDRLKILSGITYNWSEKKWPVLMQGIYSLDPSDSSGNEEISYTNDNISLGDKTNNFMYDGNIDKTVQQMGAARFRLDGAGTDYIMDAVNAVNTWALYSINISTFIIMASIVYPLLRKYCDYALLLQEDNCSMSKIIIWDKDSGYDFAKSIRTKNTWEQNGSSLKEPEINPDYNDDGQPWHVVHNPNTFVKVYDLSGNSNMQGFYNTQSYFGSYGAPALLCNYPMFFQSKFKDNLFDWFHWIDDPKHNPTLNLQWDVKIELCCEDLEKLKVFGDSSEIKLLAPIKLPILYYENAKITEITVSYDSGENDDIGKYIEIKGET